MSLFKIAWRSIQQRGLASLLTTFSMALGVMLVVAILSIHGIVAESFKNNTQLGYNMIVAATKGGKLQVTLNSVFYLSSPVENVPYDYYLEFLPAAERDRAYENSIQRAVHDATWESTQLALSLSGLGEDLAVVGLHAAAAAAAETQPAQGNYAACVQPLISQPVAAWRDGRKTRFGQLTALAIPLCLGDYLGHFRVVATVPEFFERLTFGADGGRSYEFSSGRNFQAKSDEHSYFEAVLGATVARELKLKVGDTFSPSHGASEGEGGSAHAQEFTIVGILAPTGTPNDRAAFINMEGFYLMEDHAKPVLDEQSEGQLFATGGSAVVDTRSPLPVEQREVTAILVRSVSPAVAIGMQSVIDEGSDAQVVLPILEIFRLFEVFVNPIQRLLVVLTGMICLVSGISILVSIYNSMSERRHEIAVMRALGAGRSTVMIIILLEAVMLSLGGGILGWTGGHALNWLASGRIEELTGVSLGFFDLAPGPNLLELFLADPTINLTVSTELMIIPALIGLAIVVGIFPAFSAYRTDVAQALGA